MKPKMVSAWEINPNEFDLDQVLLSLEILEGGPVTLQEYLKK